MRGICPTILVASQYAPNGELRDETDLLSDYQFGRKNIHHLFCRNCGVKSFGRANVGPDGKGMVAVMLSCVDNVTDADLASLPIMYVDGRHDDFAKAPAETRHL